MAGNSMSFVSNETGRVKLLENPSGYFLDNNINQKIMQVCRF